MNKEDEKAVAYWDLFDSTNIQLLDNGRMIKGNSTPIRGEQIIDIPGYPKSEVIAYKFKDIKDGLPHYEVYVKKIE